MSCFETSTFLKNPQVMNQAILAKACEKLGWDAQLKQEQGKQVLYVYNAQQQANLRGEYALKVTGNAVRYNNYYLKNGKELVNSLEQSFYGLNVAYAKQTILSEFQALGFRHLPDYKFTPNDTEKLRFKMVASSKLAGETEKRTEIEFTIRFDGSIVSDSNYIPEDIHTLADQAMAGIDQAFGTSRKEGEQIKRKEIPAKYKNKAYCKANNKIRAKY